MLSAVSQTHPKNKENRDPSTPRHYRTVEPQNVCRFFGALESVPRLAGSSLITLITTSHAAMHDRMILRRPRELGPGGDRLGPCTAHEVRAVELELRA